MFSFPASSCRAGRLAGAAGMLFLFTLAIPVQAAEQDELATAMRQLDQVQAVLERARVAAVQSGSSEPSRYFFDYSRARADLETIRDGIDRYLPYNICREWSLPAGASLMGMSAAQSSAFKAASGEMDISVLHLLSLGLLLAVLFLWAAWALLDVWAGWSNEKVRSAMLGCFFIRLALLLVLSIWMFAS